MYKFHKTCMTEYDQSLPSLRKVSWNFKIHSNMHRTHTVTQYGIMVYLLMSCKHFENFNQVSTKDHRSLAEKGR